MEVMVIHVWFNGGNRILGDMISKDINACRWISMVGSGYQRLSMDTDIYLSRSTDMHGYFV